MTLPGEQESKGSSTLTERAQLQPIGEVADTRARETLFNRGRLMSWVGSLRRHARRALPRLGMWVLLLGFFGHAAFGEQRFPPPDFEGGHQLPHTTTPAPRAALLQYVDVAVLLTALVIATVLIYRKRSRKGLIGLSLFSLVYFGFYRKGCICAIGSVQNVALALTNSGYAVPLAALAFFVVPLGFALFAGRSFCAGVCPHGALQDLVLLKPIKVPNWLEHGLGVLPFVYLGAGVLFAATGSAFIICQYDPFVPLFRMNGRLLMVGAGVALLLLGVFVGRPYCRFLCPYGALLKICAVVAKLRVRVTPDYCTQCRLCEASCPFGAMRVPQAPVSNPAALARDRRMLGLMLALLPVLLAAGFFIGGLFSGPASRVHPTVSLAERFLKEKPTFPKPGTLTPDELALERARQAPKEILLEAAKIRKQFRWGTRLFGGWVGLVIGVKLIGLSLRRKRIDYEPDRGECFACARCFEYCPNELVRRGIALPESMAALGNAPSQSAAVSHAMEPASAAKEAL